MCNLHRCYIFAVVLHLTALLSANQNRVIFSCVLLMIKMAKTDAVLMTKTGEKPYPSGPHIPI